MRRGRQKAVTRREDLATLTEELQRAREYATAATAAAAATTEVLHPSVEGDEQSKHNDSNSNSSTTNTTTVVDRHRGALGDKQAPAVTVDEGKAPDSTAASGGNERGAPKKNDNQDVDCDAAASVSQRLRVDARQARDDAEVAEEALRALRLELEGLAEGWTDLRMRLLGEMVVSFVCEERERCSLSGRQIQR